MNKIYKEPEFNIILTDAVDVLTGSTDGFAPNNGYSGGSNPGGFGGEGSTGVEI